MLRFGWDIGWRSLATAVTTSETKIQKPGLAMLAGLSWRWFDARFANPQTQFYTQSRPTTPLHGLSNGPRPSFVGLQRTGWRVVLLWQGEGTSDGRGPTGPFKRTAPHVETPDPGPGPSQATGGLCWACCGAVGHCSDQQPAQGHYRGAIHATAGPGPPAAPCPSHGQETTPVHQGRL